MVSSHSHCEVIDMLYDDIVSALGKAVKDPGYRDKLLKDPNGTLKAEGADLGNSVTTLEWVESTNCLNVHVANGGANWSGAVLLKIEK
ncbi:hypothetical protein GSH05_27305 [Burkholderia pseudomallei]|uniref:Uncharacterized protein n=7 Tax=Burkholderia pseudomallei TaxID=28450 RepID=Q63L12_BURPS|nr:conserved hypothetical protein [Burkholderia pseudomallei 668]ABN93634.1 hypothetical protein BURPS1106A_A1597 [Burkholderia pseudomallei 1106a]AUG24340.1 hypothetical protein CXQ84_28435 [Burkholderia pseudomallei]EEH30562.1 hypothetical protein BUH_5922 [Burkholderia pseudomallei Pakistan 9]EEP50459.1 conserved hypothetical protein [Burkholderia pseudomallei MSHR346]EES21074.1 hypothetical protein BURPS1106B_0393 [Burkholderia pseudomallei 1106b]KGW96642.1 hypothetical protein Y048_5558 